VAPETLARSRLLPIFLVVAYAGLNDPCVLTMCAVGYQCHVLDKSRKTA